MDERRETVLIAGCGYVGNALAERLLEHYVVLGLRRRGPVAPGVQPLAADLLDEATLARVVPSVPLAALVYAVSAGGHDVDAYRDAYLRGLEGLLSLLRRRKQLPERLIYVSSTGVYGQSEGERVDEASPAEPARETGAVLLEGEALARGAGCAKTTIVRFSGIYGPQRDSLIRTVTQGTARRSGTPRYTNRIHREDCAGAIAHLLELDDPAALYLASDEEPALHDDVLSWLASEHGLPLPPVETSPRSSLFGGHKRCDSRLLRDSGYRFQYRDFRAGYGSLLPASSS